MSKRRFWKYPDERFAPKPGDLIRVFGGPLGGHCGTLLSEGRYNGEATLRLKFKDREIDVFKRHCMMERKA